jgi:hypothetical protein
MENINYTINKYIGERQEEFNQEIDKGDNILFSSMCGTGKSSANKAYAEHAKKQGKRVATILPTRVLLENLKREEGVNGKDTSHIGRGNEFAKGNQNTNVVVTVWNTIKSFDKDFDIIFIDEAHLLAGQAELRKKIIGFLLSLKCQVVLLSGTPEIIEHLPNFRRINFIRKHEPIKRFKLIEKKHRFSARKESINLIKNRNKKSLLLIRINNKEDIDSIFEHYKNSGINIVKIYSGSENIVSAEQDKILSEEARKGNILHDVDVILATSIIDVGISLNVKRDVDGFMFGNKFMPNAIDTVQFFDRVRSNSDHTMQLTVIGTFGDSDVPKGYSLEEPLHELVCAKMDILYGIYSQLDFEHYIGVLGYYNIQLDIHEIQGAEADNAKHGTQSRRLKKIVSNLTNYDEEWDVIETKLDDRMLIDWKPWFNGSENLSKDRTSEVNRVIEYIHDAIECNIHPSLFIGKRFESKRFESLKDLKQLSYDKQRDNEQFIEFLKDFLKGLEVPNHRIDVSVLEMFDSSQREAIKVLARYVYSRIKYNQVKVVKLKPLKKVQKEFIPILDSVKLALAS